MDTDKTKYVIKIQNIFRNKVKIKNRINNEIALIYQITYSVMNRIQLSFEKQLLEQLVYNKSLSELTEILESIDVIIADNKNKKISKKIDISNNPKTEKIISDAEKSLDLKVKEVPLVLKKEFIKTKEKENHNLTENIIEVENNLEELKNNYALENQILKTKNLEYEEEIKDLNTLLDNFKEKDMYSDLYNKIKLYQVDNAILRKKIFKLLETETNLRLQLSEVTLRDQIDKEK